MATEVILTIQTISAIAIAVLTFFLIRITGTYAHHTKRLADLTEALLRTEAERWLSESRPYLQISFCRWRDANQDPEFAIFNAGAWSAVEINFDGRDIDWCQPENLPVILKPHSGALLFHIPNYVRPSSGSTEFRIRYRDVGKRREFADKWRFEVEGDVQRLLMTNSTTLKLHPPPVEDYVIETAAEGGHTPGDH